MRKDSKRWHASWPVVRNMPQVEPLLAHGGLLLPSGDDRHTGVRTFWMGCGMASYVSYCDGHYRQQPIATTGSVIRRFFCMS